VRTLRARLVDPIAPLPHYKIGGKIVVRRSDYDQWVARYRYVGLPEVNRLVDEVFSGPGRRR
jgi:hypothetical protein